MILLNRVRYSTGTTGTGALATGAARLGFLTPAQAGAQDGDALPYFIEEGASWAHGTGIWDADAQTLSRDDAEMRWDGEIYEAGKLTLAGTATVFVSADGAILTSAAQNRVEITSLADGEELDTNRPQIAGSAPPYSLVTVLRNGVAFGTAQANSTGAWTLTPAPSLNGNYTWGAYAAPSAVPVSVTINDPLQPLADDQGNAALMDVNSADGIYWLNGTIYASATDLYSDLGATVSGVRASFGGFLDTTDPYEYFPQPAFDSLPTLASGNGFTPALSGGELQITASSSGNGYVSYALAGYQGRAFRFTGEGRQGSSSANPPGFNFSLANAQLGGNLTSGGQITGSMLPYTVYGTGPASGSGYYGIRGTNVGNGTLFFDNWSIQEVEPIPGFVSFARGANGASAPQWGFVIDAVIPALSGTQVLFEGDANHNNHRVWLAIDGAGALTLAVRLNAVKNSELALGTFAEGDRVRVAARVSQGTNAFTSGIGASVNGGARVTDTAATVDVPGISHFRVGQDASGASQFLGTYNQIAVLASAPPADWCEYQSRLDDDVFVVGGDSYVDGANGVSLKSALASAGGKPCINIASGGTTLAQQAATYLGKDYLWTLPFVHWDGSDNGYSSITTDIANYQAMADAQGGLDAFLFVAPVPVPNPATASSSTPTAASIRCAERVAAMVAAFGAAHVFDPLAALQALGNGGTDDNNDIAAGLVPRSALFNDDAGQVHLSATAMTAVAAAAVASAKLPSL